MNCLLTQGRMQILTFRTFLKKEEGKIFHFYYRYVVNCQNIFAFIFNYFYHENPLLPTQEVIQSLTSRKFQKIERIRFEFFIIFFSITTWLIVKFNYFHCKNGALLSEEGTCNPQIQKILMTEGNIYLDLTFFMLLIIILLL